MKTCFYPSQAEMKTFGSESFTSCCKEPLKDESTPSQTSLYLASTRDCFKTKPGDCIPVAVSPTSLVTVGSPETNYCTHVAYYRVMGFWGQFGGCGLMVRTPWVTGFNWLFMGGLVDIQITGWNAINIKMSYSGVECFLIYSFLCQIVV